MFFSDHIVCLLVIDTILFILCKQKREWQKNVTNAFGWQVAEQWMRASCQRTVRRFEIYFVWRHCDIDIDSFWTRKNCVQSLLLLVQYISWSPITFVGKLNVIIVKYTACIAASRQWVFWCECCNICSRDQCARSEKWILVCDIGRLGRLLCCRAFNDR